MLACVGGCLYCFKQKTAYEMRISDWSSDVCSSDLLFLVAKAETTFKEAFQLADEVLQQGVRSITDLMVMPGLINLDFADVRSETGRASCRERVWRSV